MKNLIATTSFRYGTRRLMAGDEFEAKPRDARLLLAIKKAEEPKARGALAAPAKKPKAAKVDDEVEDTDDVRSLRQEYAALTGKNPSMRTSAVVLRERIEQAKEEAAARKEAADKGEANTGEDRDANPDEKAPEDAETDPTEQKQPPEDDEGHAVGASDLPKATEPAPDA